MARLFLVIALGVLAGAARAETLCPDGSFVPGDSCWLSFDGSHVIGGPKTLPDRVYVEGRSAVIVGLRHYHHYHHVVRVQRNRILDAPPGTPAIDIPRLGQ